MYIPVNIFGCVRDRRVSSIYVRIAFFVYPGLRVGANYRSFLSPLKRHTPARWCPAAFAIKSGSAMPPLTSPPLAFSKLALPRPLACVRARARDELARLASCTSRRSLLPRRRTHQDPDQFTGVSQSVRSHPVLPPGSSNHVRPQPQGEREKIRDRMSALLFLERVTTTSSYCPRDV